MKNIASLQYTWHVQHQRPNDLLFIVMWLRSILSQAYSRRLIYIISIVRYASQLWGDLTVMPDL